MFDKEDMFKYYYEILRMNSSVYCSFFIALISLKLQGMFSQEVTLAPERIDVMENVDVTFTCTTHSIGSFWANSENPSIWPVIFFKDDQCVVSGYLNNSLLYSWDCHRNGSFSLTILRVNETQHNIVWRCRGINFSPISNDATINIQVPVKTVEITSPTGNKITVLENKHRLVKCMTSYSRPTPSINWFMRLNGANIQINGKSSIEFISNEKGFTSAISVLNISVSREKQGAEIYCHGTNRIGKGNVSRNITFEVHYPPTIKMLLDKRVTKGSDVEFTCPTTHGYPTATNYIWTREGDDKHWFTNSFTIKNASRKDSMGYTCMANNLMVMTGNIRKNGSSSKNMTLEVLYPPSKPTLFLVSIADMNVNMPITDALIVAEHTPFTLLCNASSLPKPNLYSWGPITSLNSSVIHIHGLMRNDTDKLTCHVSNVMIPTEGSSMTGENNVTVSTDIQFSPEIGKMKNISSEEGTNVNFSCPLIYGNPRHTSVMWIRNKDGKQWLEPTFSLKNVSKTDSSVYTCRVNNTIIMTGGVISEGITNKSIEMNVLYQVSILNYVVVNYSRNDTVTVAENHTVNLRCEIEGNPVPEGRIFSQDQLDVTKTIYENYTIYSATFQATCIHKGVYTCRGTNVIKHERVSERNITLFVTCSPRQDPKAPLQRRITISRNEAMNINFTVLAYPKPTNVLINKYNGLSWVSVNKSNNFEITNTGLDIQFTIHSVSDDDYGKYRLTIRNEYGVFEHVFHVESPAIESSDPEPRNPSYNYGLIVGLPLMIFIITLVIVVGIMLYRKRYFPVLSGLFNKQQNHGMVSNNLYQNVTDSSTRNNDLENEYEKIKMNQLQTDTTNYESYKRERANESEVTYDKLEDELKDKNQYCELHVENSKKDEDISNLNEKETAIYINMKV
ncbi:hemicentin-1-like isoform X2 [Ruditapes philippinarum]|uniref:hemicentin-1-like isoform X2 n=1 Tax=Ruditapes philippinarum TaxID=129788 RepID=UPI00295B61E7|nr:hemicentin-1-like isoform X2 [Ruditapes philippinarum]